MKPIKALFALALAAGFASASLAAPEGAPQLIRVPKTEAAMQATRATTARDAASKPMPSASHKTKAKPAKGTSTKKHKAKTRAAK